VDTVALRSALSAVQFYVLEVQFALVVGLSIACLPSMVRALAPPRSALVTAAVAAATAIVLVCVVVPRTNRIFYDEHIYQGVAQNLADLQRAQMCNEGIVEYGRLECIQGEYVKQPYGYPYLLSVGYRLVGAREAVAHVTNAATVGVLAWSLFFAAALLWQRWDVARWAAVLVLAVPQHVTWSGTAASEPTAALMLVLTLVTALWFAQSRTRLSLAWLTVTAAFAVQFRVESVLIVPVIGLLLALRAPDAFRQRSMWVAVAAGTVLCAPHLCHLLAVRNEAWGATGDRLSLAFVGPNLLTNAAYYVNNERFPILLTLLALIGVIRRPVQPACALVSMFVAFWGIYLFFYAGSYDYGADIRYALMSHSPVTLLAARGSVEVLNVGRRIGRHPAIGATVAVVVALHLLTFLPQMRAVGEEAWAARADVAFSRREAGRLGRHAIVLTNNPSVFLLAGVNAAQLSVAITDTTYAAYGLQERFTGGVYVHWDFWCNADNERRALCADALSRLPNVVVAESTYRNQRLALHKLLPWPAEYRHLPLKMRVP
jgi:hypothetical protein